MGCEQLVGLRPVSDRLHGEEGGKTFLPEAELTLDLAFRLRVFGNPMADAEAPEGALELGEDVGVEVVGKAVGDQNFPGMGKVGEGGFGLDEARADDETGGIVDG